MSSPRIVLASTSPYRRELLARLRVPFEITAPGVDEVALPGEAPRATAMRLSEWKAKAAAASSEGALVIGSDQVAVLDGKSIGKPGSHEMAVLQLRTLRGRCVTFHTAVALLNTTSGAIQVAEVPTEVYFRQCTDDEIENYLALERPYDCTGSARIEGLGVALVERIVSDDPTALIGLPLMQLVTMLRNEGVRIL